MYKLGETHSYIQDHGFKHLVNIHESVAIEWVRKVCPNSIMGTGDKSIANNLKVGDGKWMNKLFVLVAIEHDKWIALVNWDGRYSIYVEK